VIFEKCGEFLRVNWPREPSAELGGTVKTELI